MASLQLPNCKKKSAAHKNGFEVLVKHLIHPDGLLILLISAKIHQVYESVLDFCHFPLVSISVSPNVSAGFGTERVSESLLHLHKDCCLLLYICLCLQIPLLVPDEISGVLVRCCTAVWGWSPVPTRESLRQITPGQCEHRPQLILLHRSGEDKEVLSCISTLCLWSAWF